MRRSWSPPPVQLRVGDKLEVEVEVEAGRGKKKEFVWKPAEVTKLLRNSDGRFTKGSKGQSRVLLNSTAAASWFTKF